jgi:hypothetical protein
MKLRKMANAALLVKRVEPLLVSGHDSYLDLKKVITDVEKPTPLPDREPTHLPKFLSKPKQLAEFSLEDEIVGVCYGLESFLHAVVPYLR